MVFHIFQCDFLLFHQALTDEQKEKLKKHRAECLTESKAEENLVNKLKSGDFKVRQTLNNSHSRNFFFFEKFRPLYNEPYRFVKISRFT